MKITAIIAEYNPFHNGHASQIQAVKDRYGADFCIVIMSGSFVQRGTPAIVDKFTRTRWALCGGADIVFELPVCFSAASAEQFAYGACCLLHRLGFVDELCFGSETTDIGLFETIADILLNPPDCFHQTVRKLTRQGNSYAAAREEALYPLLASRFSFFEQPRESFHAMLSAPNTILGIEYCKALKKLHSSIRPFPIVRSGSSYHDEFLPNNETFACASAIRNHLFLHPQDLHCLSSFVPDYVLSDLSVQPLLHENDFSGYLYYSLLGKTPDELTAYYEVSEEIAQKICNTLPSFTDVSSLVRLLKTKQYAYSRIQRSLLHILLSISKQMPFCTPNYLRLLGLKKEASHLLRMVPKQTGPVIVTKAADAKKLLSADAFPFFEKDIFASQLYGFTAVKKAGEQKIHRETAISPVIL